MTIEEYINDVEGIIIEYLDEYNKLVNSFFKFMDNLRGNYYKDAVELSNELDGEYNKHKEFMVRSKSEHQTDFAHCFCFIAESLVKYKNSNYLIDLGLLFEKVSLDIFSEKYTNIIYQPKLKNGRIPDIAIDPTTENKIVVYARILIDCKFSLTRIEISRESKIESKEVKYYSEFCDELWYVTLDGELWFVDFVKEYGNVKFILFDTLYEMASAEQKIILNDLKYKQENNSITYLAELIRMYRDDAKLFPYLEVIRKKQLELHEFYISTKIMKNFNETQ